MFMSATGSQADKQKAVDERIKQTFQDWRGSKNPDYQNAATHF